MAAAKQSAFSIKIFLPDGDPDGLRTIGKSNWTGTGIVFRRSGFQEASRREEFNRTGVYVLVGTSEGSSLPTIYVGEGAPVLPRLQAHYLKKDFWDWCVFFVTTDASLNKAHVQYLESRLLQLAAEAKKAKLDNQQQPQVPSLTEADKADMESFLADMLRIFPLVGLAVFEMPKRLSSRRTPLLYIRTRGIEARGQETPEGFLVLKDSQLLIEEAPSIPTWIKELRRDVEAQSVVIPFLSGQSHFLHDYVFKSPSAAAGVILGRAANGRTEWKTDAGITLKEFQERQVGAASCDIPE